MNGDAGQRREQPCDAEHEIKTLRAIKVVRRDLIHCESGLTRPKISDRWRGARVAAGAVRKSSKVGTRRGQRFAASLG